MAQVDLIIPNRNGRAVLPGCLNAVFAQRCTDFSVLVVDDGSTDDSVEWIKRDFPRARVLALARSRGFAGAVNRGIGATAAPYVALLNSDAEPGREWLAELVAAMGKHPEVGWCASKMVFPNGLINSAGHMFLPRMHGADIGFGEPDRDQFSQPRYVFGACAGAALYRRQMLDAVGLFDEEFFMLMEDVDLDFRAQLRGWRCLYVPGAVVVHKHAATRATLGRLNWYYLVRNSLYCALKNVPARLWRKHMAAFLGYQWQAAFDWAAAGRGGEWLAAHASLAAGMARILRKRADIQARAVVSAGELERAFAPTPSERSGG